MNLRKSLFLLLPLFILSVVIFGYVSKNPFNSASSISEQMGSYYNIPINNDPVQFDMVGAWTTGAAITGARYYGGSIGYTRNDSGWIYAFAGDSTGSGGVAAGLYRYNVVSNTWTTLAPIPVRTRITGTARLGDSIYSIGQLGAANPPTYAVQRYSINQNSWTSRANLPDSIYFNRAAGYQDSLIYSVGGYNGGLAKNVVYLYNAKTNTWRTATPLPVAKADGAMTIVGDTIVYVCGFDATGFATNTVHRGLISQSDRSQITWTTGANYPPGVRSRIYAQPWGSKGIIVAGGASSGFTGTNECFVYSPGADTWTAQANISAVMLAYQSGSVRLANNVWKFIIAGGVTVGPALTANTFIFTDTLFQPTGITPVGTGVADRYSLSQNYPNPFNPSTKINFSIPKSGLTTLKVYNTLGKEVASLVNNFQSAGNYVVEFNANNLASGTYFYRLEANGFVDTKKMLLIK